jgi:hypothetical protein
MLLIGVDYHPSFQQVAFLNQDTGAQVELCHRVRYKFPTQPRCTDYRIDDS